LDHFESIGRRNFLTLDSYQPGGNSSLQKLPAFGIWILLESYISYINLASYSRVIGNC